LRAAIGAQTAWGRFLYKAALRPQFITTFTRTAWNLCLPAGDRIELAMDCGEISKGKKKEIICEIELELKAGSAGALFDCALQLLDTIPLRIGNLSKAERGYALCRSKKPAPAVRASELILQPHMSLDEVCQRVAIDCLAQIQGNQTTLSADYDPEYLHQMRVGLRRLRSALDQFTPAVAPPTQLFEQLDWLSAALGPARDWEVMCHSTLPSLSAAGRDNSKLSDLRPAVEDIAHAMRMEALAAVQSPRFARLMLIASAWLESAAWRNSRGAAQSSARASQLPRLADKILQRHHRRMQKRGKKLDHSNPAACHKLRITAKGARYTAEFFRSLYPAKSANTYIRALAALQDELGRRNDLAVAQQLLRGLDAAKPDLHAGIKFAREKLKTALSAKKGRLRRLWKRFESCKPPHRQ
jgi:inorganic triphosphatase YgiF